MRLRKGLFGVLALGLSVLALGTVGAGSASAAEGDFKYTAKSGDSYTELARSSVIKVDQESEDLSLNAAQVTAAETWVTQEAGSPAINVGEEVTVSRASVEKFAAQAGGLDDAAKNRWQRYADQSSITVGELAEQQKPTVEEDKAQAEEEQQTAEEQQQNNTDEATEEENANENNSSRRWIVIAVVVLLVLAAVSLIRSSNNKDE